MPVHNCMARRHHCCRDIDPISPENGLCPAGPEEAQVPVCTRSLAQDLPEPDKALQLLCRCLACANWQLPYDQKLVLQLIGLSGRQCRSSWPPQRLSQDHCLACKAHLSFHTSGIIRDWRPLVAVECDVHSQGSWPSKAHHICTPGHCAFCMSG